MRPGPGAPFQLCVVGRDPFGRMLDQAAATEQIDGHGVAVRRLAIGRPAPAAATSPSSRARRRRTPAGCCSPCAASPILTVTDARAGPQRGMIHFTIVAGRVRFFIDEAEAAGARPFDQLAPARARRRRQAAALMRRLARLPGALEQRAAGDHRHDRRLLLLAGIGIILQNEAAYRDLQAQETRVQADILAASVTAALDFGDRRGRAGGGRRDPGQPAGPQRRRL